MHTYSVAAGVCHIIVLLSCICGYVCFVAYVQLSEKCIDAFDEGAPIVVDMPNGQ